MTYSSHSSSGELSGASPSSPPQVSIIIPTYNNEKFIGQALDSVLAQTCKSWEMIVVDDGSEDGTADVVAAWRGEVEYFYQDNAGPSSARNRGLASARGEFVVFLDSDDMLLPSKLSDQLACFDIDVGLGLIHSGWQTVDSNANPIETIEPWQQVEALDLKGWLQCHPFCLPAVMFRRSLLEQAGGFDPNLHQAEDIDLILRIMIAGARAQWLRKTTTLYRQHPDTLTRQTVHRVAWIQHVFAKVFSRQDLPADIARLRNPVLYDLLMWTVWQLYREGDHAGIHRSLRQSFEFFEGSKREILRSWIGRIITLARADERNGVQPDLRALLPLCKAAIEVGAPPTSDSRHG